MAEVAVAPCARYDQTLKQCNMLACTGLTMLGTASDYLQACASKFVCIVTCDNINQILKTQIEYMAASLCSLEMIGMPALDCIK